MLNQKQFDYLVSLDEVRFLEYLDKRSIDEVVDIKKDIENHIKTIPDRKMQEEFLTRLSFVDAKINGLLQHGQESSQQDESQTYIRISKFQTLDSKGIIETLGKTIKRDEENIVITFLGMLSAYTDEEQFNISFNAPSSSGKSYIPTEIAQLFPKEDIMLISYSSPQAFYHEEGYYDKEKNQQLIDLSHKIIIFLDQPNPDLLERLRSLLSHDKKEIVSKITDKNQRGGNRTKTVVLIGFPSVIFCTAGLQINEQELTRFILLSPQITQEKIREAVWEKIKRSSDLSTYQYGLEVDEKRRLLKDRIVAIKKEHITEIIIKNPEVIQQMFSQRIKIYKPRHQRDIGRIISLIKSFALLNIFFRVREGAAIVVNDDDIKEAFKLWDAISESQELGIPPYIYNLYREIILPAYEQKNSGDEGGAKIGISRQEIVKKHFEVYGRQLSDYQLRKEIIPMLETAGLISQEHDEVDKRKMLVYPTLFSTISSKQNNSGVDRGAFQDGGENYGNKS